MNSEFLFKFDENQKESSQLQRINLWIRPHKISVKPNQATRSTAERKILKNYCNRRLKLISVLEADKSRTFEIIHVNVLDPLD